MPRGFSPAASIGRYPVPLVPRDPVVRWRIDQHGGPRAVDRKVAFLNAPATKLLRAIAQDLGINLEIEQGGIVVLRGEGEHEGQFALQVVRFQKHSPFVRKCRFYRRDGGISVFYGGALIRIQERGWSTLTRDGDCLMGTFGSVFPAPNQKYRAPGTLAVLQARRERMIASQLERKAVREKELLEELDELRRQKEA